MRPTTWLPDPSHYPEQMTPLSATTWFEAIGRGLHEAMRELRGPFGGFEARTELGWAYEGEWEPEWDHDPDRMERVALEIASRWETELAPHAHAITADLRRMRPEHPSPGEAIELLDRAWNLVLEQWKVHFLAVIPAQVAAEMFSRRYTDAVGGDELAPYRILEAVPNETNEADLAVWRLARRARELGVDDILRAYPPELVVDRLGELAVGRELLYDLHGYLLRFGGRARWHELSLPREAEAPHMTLESIRLFLDTDAAPHTNRDEDVERLERTFLEADPEAAQLLQAAKAGHALKESHAYHIDYPGLLATREVLLAFGRRLLTEGKLSNVKGVWMLRREELRQALEERSDLDPLIQERRDELAKGRREGSRSHLGDPPEETERDTILEKFYGSGAAEAEDLVGAAASRGTARGRARVVTGPQGFGRVEPGDVLVATTTTPAWTSLFPSLAALVTETGGILCHGAIVAREYGIPAVVGLSGATQRIPDGALISVDGTTGRVEILSD